MPECACTRVRHVYCTSVESPERITHHRVPSSAQGLRNLLTAGHNLPDKSCVADTAMQIELA